MKRLFFLFLSVLLFLCSCSPSYPHANETALQVKNNRALLEQCVEEMEKFGKERIYVAMEKEEEGERIRLVSYPKESGERTEIENPVLERALLDLDLSLIFYQTASDSRRCVIFSYTKENQTEGVQNGFYYSFDSLPCAWWGRRGELKRQGERYLQLNRNGGAAYYTTPIEQNFYYFEKYGTLIA